MIQKFNSIKSGIMKTTKTKTVSKTKKTPDAVKTVKKKGATGKYIPSEDEVREKAREIYYERIARGEHGTPEGDWREAEELLKGS
jgi:RAB protein geranylgeranyltransferase component A